MIRIAQRCTKKWRERLLYLLASRRQKYICPVRAEIARQPPMRFFALAIAGWTGRNGMMQTNEMESEYFGDGWQIVGHTCSRYFGPEWREEQADDKGIVLPRGLYGKNGRLTWIMQLIAQGRGTREIIRTAKVTGRTVRKYRDVLQKLTGKT